MSLSRARPWLAAALCSPLWAAAQPAAPVLTPVPEVNPSQGVSERARRAAERPLVWIRQQAELPKPAPEPRRPAPPPAARPVAALNPAALVERAPPAAGPVSAGPPTTDPQARPQDGPGTRPTLPVIPVPETPAPVAVAEPPPAPPAAPAEAEPARKPAPLRLVESVDPDFPSGLIQRLRRATLQVQVAVDAEGRVTEAKVLSSSNGRLDAAALEAVRRWRFAPPGAPTQGVIDLRVDLDA